MAPKNRSPRTPRVADADLLAVLEGRRHLLFDGGMGTMLQAAGLEAGELPELLCLTDAAGVQRIQDRKSVV